MRKTLKAIGIALTAILGIYLVLTAIAETFKPKEERDYEKAVEEALRERRARRTILGEDDEDKPDGHEQTP